MEVGFLLVHEANYVFGITARNKRDWNLVSFLLVHEASSHGWARGVVRGDDSSDMPPPDLHFRAWNEDPPEYGKSLITRILPPSSFFL
jgi:hypothetical protein